LSYTLITNMRHLSLNSYPASQLSYFTLHKLEPLSCFFLFFFLVICTFFLTFFLRDFYFFISYFNPNHNIFTSSLVLILFQFYFCLYLRLVLPSNIFFAYSLPFLIFFCPICSLFLFDALVFRH
jgi:hypothetical protein